MKILHFFKTYLPDTFGGIEQVIHQIATGAHRAGSEVTVLTLSPNAKGREEIDGPYKIIRLPVHVDWASTPIGLGAFKEFRALARRVDVVHLHFPWPFADIVSLAEGMKKPVIVTYHSDVVKQRVLNKLYGPIARSFLSRVSRIVASSPQYAESSVLLKRFSEKVTVVPFGLSEESYPTPDDAVLRRWRERVGDGFFLFIGVFRYYKGLRYLIEAVRGERARIVLVGSGPLEGELRRQTVGMPEGQVRFLGKLPEVDKVALLKLCGGVVMPSCLRSEAFGITLLEGAMFGKPLISCEIGTGTSFVNIHNQTGLVVRPADFLSLRDALQYLDRNRSEMVRLGRGARARFLAEFTADRMIDRYVKLYEAACVS